MFLRRNIFLIGLLALMPETAWAEDFYKGKTIRFIVGLAPGGGYDTYLRTIARHIGKHIPGNPSATVENMEGAGSLVSAHYVYRQSNRDGLTIVMFNNSLVVRNGLGDRRVKMIFASSAGWVRPACRVERLFNLSREQIKDTAA